MLRQVFRLQQDPNVHITSETACRLLRGKAAGVPSIRLHNTGHTCPSMLAVLNVHPLEAMRILRHSQIWVTMNVNTQIASPETRKALDQLNESLDR